MSAKTKQIQKIPNKMIYFQTQGNLIFLKRILEVWCTDLVKIASEMPRNKTFASAFCGHILFESLDQAR